MFYDREIAISKQFYHQKIWFKTNIAKKKEMINLMPQLYIFKN